MKLGTENKRKTQIATGLLVVAILLFVRMIMSRPSIPPRPAPRTANSTAAETAAANDPARHKAVSGSQDRTLSAMLKPSLDPRLRLDLLKISEGVDYKGSGRDIFRGEPDIAIPQPVGPGRTDNHSQAQVPVNTGPPPPPPINLKFFGYATRTGMRKSIFLAQGDSVFTAREGDIVAGRYRVMKINATSVEIRDVLSNNTQTIPLTQG